MSIRLLFSGNKKKQIWVPNKMVYLLQQKRITLKTDVKLILQNFESPVSQKDNARVSP